MSIIAKRRTLTTVELEISEGEYFDIRVALLHAASRMKDFGNTQAAERYQKLYDTIEDGESDHVTGD